MFDTVSRFWDNSVRNMKATNLVCEFLRYAVVGGIAFVADFGVMVATAETVFRPFSCGVYLSVACGFLAGLSVNYVLSIRYVFTDASCAGKGRTLGAFLAFGTIGLIGLALTEFGMWVGVAVLGVHYTLVKAVVTVLVLLWNYLARRVIVFGGGLDVTAEGDCHEEK